MERCVYSVCVYSHSYLLLCCVASDNEHCRHGSTESLGEGVLPMYNVHLYHPSSDCVAREKEHCYHGIGCYGRGTAAVGVAGA